MNLSEREKELLDAAAGCFSRHEGLSEGFLDQHQVTFGECADLLGTIGEVLSGYLALPPIEQVRLRLLGAGFEPELVHAMLHVWTHNQALKLAASELAKGSQTAGT